MNPWPQRCERCALPAELHPHASWRTNGLSLGIWYVLVKQNFAACAAVPFPAVLVLLRPARFLRKKPFPVPAFSPQESKHPSASGQASEDTRPSAAIFTGRGCRSVQPTEKPDFAGPLIRIRTVSAGPALASWQAGETVSSISRVSYAFFPYARICSTRCVVE